MCSITPPRYSSSPSYNASTSTSMASSRNLSISTGCSGLDPAGPGGDDPPDPSRGFADPADPGGDDPPEPPRGFADSVARVTYSRNVSSSYTISMPRPPST